MEEKQCWVFFKEIKRNFKDEDFSLKLNADALAYPIIPVLLYILGNGSSVFSLWDGMPLEIVARRLQLRQPCSDRLSLLDKWLLPRVSIWCGLRMLQGTPKGHPDQPFPIQEPCL